MDDGEAVHLIEHVRARLHAQPDIEVLVGSDSQNRCGHTIYTTTVVLRYRKNGAHVLYRREKRERIRDLWTRLWGEVERSLDVAHHLMEGGVTGTRPGPSPICSSPLGQPMCSVSRTVQTHEAPTGLRPWQGRRDSSD
jgi:hypothetical protein